MASGKGHRLPGADRCGQLGEGTVRKADLHAPHRLREQRSHPANRLPTLTAGDTTQQRLSLGATVTALHTGQIWTPAQTRR